MGRIEEALAKLHAQRGGPAARSPVGRFVDAGLPPAEQLYGGRHIAVDMNRLRAHGLMAPENEERRLADEYRTIKRPLLENASKLRDPPIPLGNLLMITSAVAGEGKTFTSLNLCLSIARERDWNAVLVDADAQKRHLTRLFGAEKEQGLLDLLRDPKLVFDSLVMPTDVPGFFLLPAGQADEHSTELLSSSSMQTLCAQLATRPGSMFVFDSAPLLMSSDPLALAGQVGQVLLVVLANKTAQEAVLQACEKLDDSKAVSLLLNQAS